MTVRTIPQDVSVPLRGEDGLEPFPETEKADENHFSVSVPLRGEDGLEPFSATHQSPLPIVSVPLRGEDGLELLLLYQ